MAEYNASDLKSIRKAAKAAKVLDAERQSVILNLMSSPSGRSYMYDRLVRCHVFASSFSSSALAMAFAEGERNAGLQDLNDIMQCAPDQYIFMMREATDRISADGRRDSSESQPARANSNGDDSGSISETGGVRSDYDPTDGADAGTEG